MFCKRLKTLNCCKYRYAQKPLQMFDSLKRITKGCPRGEPGPVGAPHSTP